MGWDASFGSQPELKHRITGDTQMHSSLQYGHIENKWRPSLSPIKEYLIDFRSMKQMSTELLESEDNDIHNTTSKQKPCELEEGYKESSVRITENERIKCGEKGVVSMLSEGIGDKDRY